MCNIHIYNLLMYKIHMYKIHMCNTHHITNICRYNDVHT